MQNGLIWRSLLLWALDVCIGMTMVQSLRAQFELRMDEEQAQESPLNGQTICFTQLMDAMVNSKRPTYFRNITIRFDMERDKKGMDLRWVKGGEQLIVRHSIWLYDCDFDREFWMVLRDMTFEGWLSMYNCNNLKAIFKDCTFNNAFRCFGNEFEFMDFYGCTFAHGFKWGRGFMMDHLKFEDCRFAINPALVPYSFGPDMESRILLVSNKLEEFDLTLKRCHFWVPDSLRFRAQYFVTLAGTHYSNLRILNCHFDACLNLTQASISNLFQSYGTDYKHAVVIDALNLNPVNTKLDWNTLDNYRLAVFTPSGDTLVGGFTPDRLTDLQTVNTLISCYANLYQAFRTQGNRLAANACYVEWKNLETRFLKSYS